MAETDGLDDFFAKKDKSNKKKGKSKSKGKMVVSDLIPASSPTPPNELTETTAIVAEQVNELKLENPAPESKDKKKCKKKKDRDGGDVINKNEVSYNSLFLIYI